MSDEQVGVQDARKKDWFHIDNAVLTLGLSPHELAVYVALARYASWETGECYPSLKTIAELSGMKTSTARKHLTALQERGLVSVIARQRDNGSQTSNLYTLLTVPPLSNDSTPPLTSNDTPVTKPELTKEKTNAASGGITGADAQGPTEATAQAIVCNQCGERVDIQRGYIDNRDGVFTCYSCFTPDQRNRLEAVIAAQPTAQDCPTEHGWLETQAVIATNRDAQPTHCPTCKHQYRTLRDGNNAAFQVCNCTTIESLMADGWLEYPMPQDYAECYDPPPNCETPRYASSALIDPQPTHAPGNLDDLTTDKCPDCGECMTWQSVWSSLHWRWCDVCGVKRTGYDAWHGQPSTEPFQDLNANPNAVTFPPPIDDNGNWVESLTHPGMMVERIEETLSYPPVEPAQVIDVATPTATGSLSSFPSFEEPAQPEPEPPAEALTKKQGAIIAKLLLSQGKPLAFAGSRDKSPISQLLIIGHIKKSLSRVGAWELTDTGQALAEHPHVTYAIALAGSIDAQHGVADKRGKKRTKGKFNLSPEYQPIFNELCALFSLDPTLFDIGDWKFYSGIARDLYNKKASAEETIEIYNWCAAKKWPTGFGPGALTKNLQQMRGERSKKQAQVDTTLQFDESGYGESDG